MRKMDGITKKRNTRVNYLYRDASNYKQHNEEIIAGAFTSAQIEAILDCLDSGEYFIPSQVGFSEVRFGEITEDDHCWFELCANDFEETDLEPTCDMTPDEVVRRFREAKGAWEEHELTCFERNYE